MSDDFQAVGIYRTNGFSRNPFKMEEASAVQVNFDIVNEFFQDEDNVNTLEEDRRFAEVNDEYVEKLIEGQENKNTKRKTFYDLKLVHKFIQEVKNEERDIKDIPAIELNNLLSQFIVEARTKTGQDYEPSSLRGILSSVERHLSKANYNISIFRDPEFKKTRDALKAKQKELKSQGRGNRPHATSALSDEEIEVLYSKKLLGTSSPQSLHNTVWLNNMVHFGLRGGVEQRSLCWGDITLKAEVGGKEYLEYSERQTKTRTGANPRDQRQVKPRMYANPLVPERDPVHAYKLYKEQRPETMLSPDSSFYLSLNVFKTEAELISSNSKWFKAQPMGVNKLNSVMRDMTKAANIPTKTNHSGRKTMIQKLQNSDIPPNQIIQISGHKNLQSVNNYSSLNGRQMENISQILSNPATSGNAIVPIAQRQGNLPPFPSQLSQSTSSTSTAVENSLQAMFHANYIAGGVFNINLPSAKSPVKKKRRYILDSDSSQE